MPPTQPRTRLTPERWARLQELFERACALDPEARARFLVEECGADVSLREQVVALLLANSTGGDDFESRYEQAICDVLKEADLPAGTIVGRYRIQRLLGRGGMGAVYLAERADEQFHHIVALKIVARNLLHAEIAGRFRSERQILARLNHPNIARLLDGGHTEDGTPYFVMEYVEGQRIDHYCRERSLSLQGRLRLVQQVCAAVQYAHQNLIVHRDLKAANIMVGSDGLPKLLDFGIAKIVQTEEASEPALTRMRDRVLTPEYASPEQLRGEPVGTASDIYNLGRLLYELLSGASPFCEATRSPTEFERLICEGNTPPPSARAPADAAAGTRSLRRALQGDLDNIVLKAMHVDPARRYSSAAGLAEDIQNYLVGHPVHARADTFAYRTGKFLRRHAWSTASIATAVVVIAGLTAFYTSSLAAERDRAMREMNKAKQVAQFLGSIFQAPDPWRGADKPVSAIELLDQGAADIERRLKGDPETLSALLSEIGRSYKNLADYDRADRMLRRSLEVEAAAGLMQTHEYGDTLYELANVQRFSGQFAAAEKSFNDGLALERRLTPGPSADTAAYLTHLGMLYYEMGRWSEALPLEREALPMTVAVFGERNAESADRMNNLALALEGAGHFVEAEQYFRKAIAIQAQVLPPRNPDVLGTQYNLDGLHSLMGHYASAERHMRAILPERRAVLGNGHPRIGNALTALGSTLTSLGKFDDAEQTLNEALAILTEKLGPNHFRTSNALRSLGQLALAKGDAAGAEEVFRRVEGIESQIFGATSDTVCRTRSLLAAALVRQGKASEAEPLLESSFRQLYADGKAVSGNYDVTLVELGGLRLAEGRTDEAAALYHRSLQIFAGFGVPNHPDTAEALLGLARVARARNDAREAVALKNKAIANLRAELPEKHWRVVRALSAAHSMT